MRKIAERDDHYSCWNRAEETECVFILLSRDVCSPFTIRFWCFLRWIRGRNKWRDKQIQEAWTIARTMELER